jgi:hypothetical protein
VNCQYRMMIDRRMIGLLTRCSRTRPSNTALSTQGRRHIVPVLCACVLSYVCGIQVRLEREQQALDMQLSSTQVATY